MISKTDRAYCAGLFEGEGTIHARIRSYKRKFKEGYTTQRNISLAIAMAHQWPLEIFADAFGMGTVIGPFPNRAPNGIKPMYEFKTARFENIQFIVCNMWDWLSPERKLQCAKALKTYTSYELKNTPSHLKRNHRGDYR